MTGFKRKVFYMGGFDPRGVRFYHNLYRETAARWAERTGRSVSVSPRRRVSDTRVDWTVTNETDGATTSYSFLRWEDLVQRSWERNGPRLAWRAARTYGGHVLRMDKRMLFGLPRGPVVTLFYPPLAYLLLPAALGLLPFLLLLLVLPPWAALAAGLALGVAAAGPLLKRTHSDWLLRFFIFNAETAGGEADPALSDRLDRFAADILAELVGDGAGDWDEVLLVTHSNGSILAVPLMERLLRAHRNDLPDSFTLVTLGQCIPLILLRRDAARFRAQVAEVARGHFHWVDIGSPPDGAGFHAVNPMAFVTSDWRPHLDQLSPRFHLFYDPATYHKGWANKYEIHFDYLRVGDRPSPLDYPALTVSAQPIDASVDDFRRIP